MRIGTIIVLITINIVKMVVLISNPYDFDLGLMKFISLLFINPNIQFVRDDTIITRN